MLWFAMTVDTESNLQVKSMSSVPQVAVTADTESGPADGVGYE